MRNFTLLFFGVISIYSNLALAWQFSGIFEECQQHLMAIDESKVPKDRFINDLKTKPIETYLQLASSEKQAYTHALSGVDLSTVSFSFHQAEPVLLKVIADLNHRLEQGSVLELPQFSIYYQKLSQLRGQAITLYFEQIPYRKYNEFMMNWIETMDALLRSADPQLKGTYHRDINRRELPHLMDQGDYTYMVFSFQDVDDTFFWKTRAVPIYFHGIFNIPHFQATAKTYNGGPLVPTNEIQKFIDGFLLDLEEYTKHDSGHSFFKKRRDLWLYLTAGGSMTDLINEFNEIEVAITTAVKQLKNKDFNLWKAVRLLVTEIIHERGYQYYLPILQQQLSTGKWVEVIRKKKANNYWGRPLLNDEQELRLEEARKWLYHIVEAMLVMSNRHKIEVLNAKISPIILKKWNPIKTFVGRPIDILINEAGNVKVAFETLEGLSVSTSLYEISLAQISVEKNSILNHEKIKNLNQLLWLKRNKKKVCLAEDLKTCLSVAEIRISTSGDFIVSLSGSNVQRMVDFSQIVISAEVLEMMPHEFLEADQLSDVEIFKIEQVINLAKKGGTTELTITVEPEVFRGQVVDVNEDKKSLKLRIPMQGVQEFPLSSISIQRP